MTNSYALIIDNSKTSQAITRHMLDQLEVKYVAVSDHNEAWEHLVRPTISFCAIIISRQALPSDYNDWMLKLRGMVDYEATPVLLLVDGKAQSDKMNALYDSGFTQVFCRQDLNQLSVYIKQIRQRSTFSEARGNKAIIIEDDLVQQLLIKSMLDDNQCECFCFTSAEEALTQVGNIEPDVILCDFFLDGVMTALDMILHCRDEAHPWLQVPILVMTALDDPARKVEMVRSGANDYLAKPLDPIDVSLRVENLIRYKHLLDKVESQHKQMQYLAMHDQLTGLYNRHYVAEQMERIVKDANLDNGSCALIVTDIDHFKQVNDQNGHDVGDKVLVAIGELLQQMASEDDIPARLGGEEFILILQNQTMDAAVTKANDIRLKIEQLKPEGLTITASFGVALLDQEHNDFERLFKAADDAVYKAKRSGRNRVERATGSL